MICVHLFHIFIELHSLFFVSGLPFPSVCLISVRPLIFFVTLTSTFLVSVGPDWCGLVGYVLSFLFSSKFNHLCGVISVSLFFLIRLLFHEKGLMSAVILKGMVGGNSEVVAMKNSFP